MFRIINPECQNRVVPVTPWKASKGPAYKKKKPTKLTSEGPREFCARASLSKKAKLTTRWARQRRPAIPEVGQGLDRRCGVWNLEGGRTKGNPGQPQGQTPPPAAAVVLQTHGRDPPIFLLTFPIIYYFYPFIDFF